MLSDQFAKRLFITPAQPPIQILVPHMRLAILPPLYRELIFM